MPLDFTTPVPVPSNEEWRAGLDFLDTAVDGHVAALWDTDREETEEEIDRLVRDGLERRYSEYILSRETLAGETKKQYLAAIKQFHAFCKEGGVSSAPSRVGTVALFLDTQLENGASAVKMRRLVAAISYLHRKKKLFDPTNDFLVKAIIYKSTKTRGPK
jgi:hypothetical protein